MVITEDFNTGKYLRVPEAGSPGKTHRDVRGSWQMAAVLFLICMQPGLLLSPHGLLLTTMKLRRR